MKKYSIGQVAKMTEMPAKTLRFYEEQGVIQQASREENGYRFFTEENLEEIRLIKNARDLGLPLSEIKKLTVGCCDDHRCEHSQEYVEESIGKYLALLSGRITEMSNLKTKLEGLIQSGPYCCEILHQLAISNEKGGE